MASTKTSQKVQPLQLPQYDAFETISRCCHWAIYIQEKKAKMLTPESYDYNSSVKLKNQVLFFVPSGPEEEYNKHGNLSYVINWEMVIDRCGPNMYLLDQAIDSIQGYTSVLLTSNDYDKKLEKLSLITKGSPILRSGGKFYQASSCLCEERLGPHEVIIVVESNRSADAKWLLRNSDVRPNDHSLANWPFGGLFKCVLYNTIRGEHCPFPWTFQQARQMIKSVNPELTFSVGPVNQLSGGGEPPIENNQSMTKTKEKETVEDDDEVTTSEERTNRLQENQTNTDISVSSTTNAEQGREIVDENHLHNCVVTLTALFLVNIRYVMTDETLIQLMMLALVVALRYHVLPALWPQQAGPPAVGVNCDGEEESSDGLDVTENYGDESGESDKSFS